MEMRRGKRQLKREKEMNRQRGRFERRQEQMRKKLNI